jgi:hypothetical protein
MANTYVLIASNVLASAATSTTFSSIPQTYTDLVIMYSARGANLSFQIRLNGNTATNYSNTGISGSGSAAASFRDTTQTSTFSYYTQNLNTYTASVFSNGEFYLPNYTASLNKAFSTNGATENNASNAFIASNAHLWRNTAAVTSITFTSNAGNIDIGSSFYLYGIKNS